MNLSQQSGHLVLGTTTTLPAPAGVPAPAEAPLLSEKEVQVGAMRRKNEHSSWD